MVEEIGVELALSQDTPKGGLDLKPPEGTGEAPPAGPEGEPLAAPPIGEEELRRLARLAGLALAEVTKRPGMELDRIESEELVPVWAAAIQRSEVASNIVGKVASSEAVAGLGYAVGRRLLLLFKKPEGAQEGIETQPAAAGGGRVVNSGGKQFLA